MAQARLLYANNSDWRYITGLDPETQPNLWYQDVHGQTHIFAGNRDFAAWQKEARVNHVHNWNDIVGELKKSQLEASFVNMLGWLMERTGKPSGLEIPSYTPINFYTKLQSLGVPLEVNPSSTFFPARVIKSAEEIAHLQAAQQLNEELMHHAVNILTEAKIGRDKALLWRGAPLTSELLRQEMETLTIRKGGRIGIPTIVSCGAQAALPHERGHGPLFADQFILIDSFPIGPAHYWGDMSRTFVKGTPSHWHTQVYEAVLAAFNFAVAQLKPGADGQAIHSGLDAFFEAQNMPSGTDSLGQPYGWKKMHGLGHSVGLDIHDPGAYTLNSAPCILKPGMITSVEPGLYYPTNVNGGVGGVRIEDVVAITETGHANLTTFPKDMWVID